MLLFRVPGGRIDLMELWLWLCICLSFSPVQHQLSLKTVSVLLQRVYETIFHFFFVVSLVYEDAQVHQSAQAMAGISHIGKNLNNNYYNYKVYGKNYRNQCWNATWHSSTKTLDDYEIIFAVEFHCKYVVESNSRSGKLDKCSAHRIFVHQYIELNLSKTMFQYCYSSSSKIKKPT